MGVILLLIFVGFGILFGSQIAKEFDELTETLPQKITQLKATISEWPLGDELMGEEDGEQEDNGDTDGEEENDDDENGNGGDLPDDYRCAACSYTRSNSRNV